MTHQEITPIRSGKVRDVYAAGDNLIVVSSDRISAFDCILPTPIPDKGKILNTLSAFWFKRTAHIIENHVLQLHATEFPAPYDTKAEDWGGRSMLVRKANVIPVECVVRGYLAGSGWVDYQKTGKISGIELPTGLRESDQLPEPIFTPSTKADVGHDEPIDFDQVIKICGLEHAMKLRDTAIALYKFAADYARERGIIIADTKFEFGLVGDELILIDEIFTPDSSRFWDVETYEPGRSQDSFDKQFVRDYLLTLDWDKTPPAPALPEGIAVRTAEKYQEAYRRITGLIWPDSEG